MHRTGCVTYITSILVWYHDSGLGILLLRIGLTSMVANLVRDAFKHHNIGKASSQVAGNNSTKYALCKHSPCESDSNIIHHGLQLICLAYVIKAPQQEVGAAIFSSWIQTPAGTSDLQGARLLQTVQ